MFTRRGLPARSHVMESRGSPTALLLSSSPVLGSAFTGNALLRSAVVTRRPAESGQDRFGLFPFDEFFAACFRSPRAARGAQKSAVFSRLIDIVVHVTLVPNRLRIRAAPSILR
jgi:hypothetical protein